MIEPVEAAKELIPPQKNEERVRTGMKRAEFGSEAALDSLDPPEGAPPASSAEEAKGTGGDTRNRTTTGAESDVQHKTIDSSIAPRDEEGKTVTIDAS